MRITRKFTLAIAAGILVVHAGSVAVRAVREQRLFETDMARDARMLGLALSRAAEHMDRTLGPTPARELVEHAASEHGHLTVRWIPLAAWKQAVPPVAHPDLTSLAEGGQATVTVPGPGGGVYTYTRVRGTDGAIEVGDPSADEHEYFLASLRNGIIAALALVLACTAVAALVGRLVVGRPVRLLVEYARRVGAGDLQQRLNLQRKDELGELAAEFDLMVDGLVAARDRADRETETRLATEEQLRHADRLTTVGTLASGIAHELGTPLNVVQGHAKLILEDPRVPLGARDACRIILRQTRRMTGIIRQLLDFARHSRRAEKNADVMAVARQTMEMLAPLARKANVTTEVQAQTQETRARIGSEQLQQVLMNLGVNAIQSMPRGGVLRIGVEAASTARRVRLYVRDEGEGMDPALQRRIFEPFFTTKDVGEGTGLGLAVAYGLVRDSGGRIEVESVPGKGTRFTIDLPATTSP